MRITQSAIRFASIRSTTIRIVCLAAALCSIAFAALPSAAAAQDPRGDVTQFDFEDHLVPGDLVSPMGEILSTRRRRPRESLIEIRKNFIAELFKSVEDL